MTRAFLMAACLLLLGTSMALADDTLWTRRDSGDYTRALLVDQEDDIIAVGTRLGPGSGLDVVVVKYSPDGTRQWYVTVAGPGALNDEARGAALDPEGNIYITASSGLFPDFDIVTVKLDPTGSEVWGRNWGGPDNKQDVPAGIAVDTAGNSYVTGYTTAANGTCDWVTMKLESDSGLPMWVDVRESEGGGVNYPTAIALGPGDAPYITGYNQRVYLEDYATVKYNTAGVEQWASFYNYSGNGSDKAVDIVVDDVGDAYVTGTSSTGPAPAGIDQFATIKYDDSDSGAQVWVARYTATGGPSEAGAIALGDSAVYVTGSSQEDTGDYDYATIAYGQSSGIELWRSSLDGVPGNAVDLAVLPYGMVLVTGSSGNDIMTLRYTDAGVEDWVVRYSDAGATAITFDSHCSPIVLGTSFDSERLLGFLIIKYDSAAFGGIAELKPAVPVRPGMRLAPNPARDWTNVQHSLSGALPGIISLLGVDGRVVSTQPFDGQSGMTTRLDLTGLASGVYIVRLVVAGRLATSRLVVQK